MPMLQSLLVYIIFVLPLFQVLLDDSHLLAASEDRTWTIWDMHQEKVRNVFRADMGAVRGIALAPDQVSNTKRKKSGIQHLLI